MSENFHSPRRWRVRQTEKLLWRSWHEEDENGDYLTLLYHTESDDTHLLNAMGAEILRILCENEASEEEILRQLEERLGRVLPHGRDLEHFLDRMRRTGVLEVVSQESK